MADLDMVSQLGYGKSVNIIAIHSNIMSLFARNTIAM